MAKPVPPHFGQVTNPLRWLWSQTLHFPTTTQDSLRASPVPLHAGQATSRFPPQRGHSALSSPTGIPPFSRNRSPTEIRNAQSAVSGDRLYVILAMCTTPEVIRTFKSAATSDDPCRMAPCPQASATGNCYLAARTRAKSRAPFMCIMAPAGLKTFPSKLAKRS